MLKSLWWYFSASSRREMLFTNVLWFFSFCLCKIQKIMLEPLQVHLETLSSQSSIQRMDHACLLCELKRKWTLQTNIFLVMAVTIVWGNNCKYKQISTPKQKSSGEHVEIGENVCREVHMHPSKSEICRSYWDLYLVADWVRPWYKVPTSPSSEQPFRPLTPEGKSWQSLSIQTCLFFLWLNKTVLNVCCVPGMRKRGREGTYFSSSKKIYWEILVKPQCVKSEVRLGMLGLLTRFAVYFVLLFPELLLCLQQRRWYIFTFTVLLYLHCIPIILVCWFNKYILSIYDGPDDSLGSRSWTIWVMYKTLLCRDL